MHTSVRQPGQRQGAPPAGFRHPIMFAFMGDLEQLAKAIDLRGKTVADIGCGDGAFVRALASAGADAIGVEVSEAAVARARERDPAHRYELGGAERLPFEDGSIDVATLMRSLH